MTRINAGSTLANQFAPPFVVSDSVANNWELRWNATLLAFEAFDPSELVVAAGFESIQQQLFNNVTNQQVFILPWVAASEESLYITINGVKQHTNTYTISAGTSTTTVTLGGTATGDVEFIGLQATGGASIDLFTAVGDGSTTTYVLSWLAPSEQSLLITIDGIRQHTDSYSITSNPAFTNTTITFATAPADQADIEVVGITTTGEVPSSPVNASNLGSGTGVFGAKRQIGEEQILDFKSLVAGARVAITSTDLDVTIAADDITFTNTGTGENSTNNATTVDFSLGESLEFRALVAGSQISLTLSGSAGSEILTWDFDPGRVVADDPGPHNAVVGENIIAVQNLVGARTIVLPLISTLTVGEAITVKNETAGTSTITIQPHATDSAATIDGSGTATITAGFGYITLYTNGTNFFKIAEG